MGELRGEGAKKPTGDESVDHLCRVTMFSRNGRHRSTTRCAVLAQTALVLAVAGCSGSSPSSTSDSEPTENGHSSGGGRPEQECASCHPNHVAEWRISPHAYAMRDPVFLAMVRLGQKETQGELGQFCTQCHSPTGVADGETEVAFDSAAGAYRQQVEDLSVAASAGVSCEVCHSITFVDDQKVFNAQFEMTRDGVRRATISDPVPSPVHESAYSQLHSDSDICGVCHQVVSEFFTERVALEKTMMEWVQSTFPGRKECQDCHMTEYTGPAAEGGPTRDVHRHFFTGVDVSLLPPEDFPGYDEMRALVTSLLQESAELSVQAIPEEKALALTIVNLAGHALPSGATAHREMWVETIVKDATGQPVFESGTLDENGDLRVDYAPHTTEPGTDPQLILYHQEMYFDPLLEDPASTEPRRRVEFLWEPNVEESFLISAGGRSERRYDLTQLPAGDYTATVRLLFRSFPPHLMRELAREAALDVAVGERVPTVEMESVSVAFTLP